ncbi:uncharacterized protein YppC [Halalkalibacter wakoensis JCM 9140]|uniref:Uncharacterized protein YppC n=1 Tax=Halalkalibacter wakoensis JCM 9140 TaxID=1236970 RepID=W4PZZ9_9BACI|nr:DUF2515 family protein [Halalkalibacter wakoensis]GAE25028.1 uncharacterized protein YppC [Halalkalibacter wakoensis JCM 9140]
MTIVDNILRKMKAGNKDNISRTIMYEDFYKKHPEIRWALLAGMVSRNAGWNMTDLQSKWFQKIISSSFRSKLFHTFERANWTIFADAYPQLLWYEHVKKEKNIDFNLLEKLQVSSFMQKEWKHFLEKGDVERLCTALIVNEQHVIEETVMKHPLYRRKVFSSILYVLEEHAHMSYVIFPTIKGEVYGLYVRNFKQVSSRIWLGRQLYHLLFHPDIYQSIFDFSRHTLPSGSRADYEQYMGWTTGNTSPTLRTTYPIVQHHWNEKIDWSLSVTNTEKFFSPLKKAQPIERTAWLKIKWIELYLLKKFTTLVT